VCSSDVRRRSFPRSGHGMSVDIDRDQINAAVLDWFDGHSRSSRAGAPATAHASG
jgi:hypothetical protein